MPSKWLGRKQIALRAKELRDRIGASQGDLADRLGLKKGQGAISDLENGRWRGVEPNAKLLVALCRLAGEDIGYFRKDGPAAPDERAEKLIAAKWMERAAKRLREEATGQSPTVWDEVREVTGPPNADTGDGAGEPSTRPA